MKTIEQQKNNKVEVEILEPTICLTKDEVKDHCMKFFGGDELATSVVMNKYLLRDDDGNFIENSPEDMLKNRIAPEFARIEKKYPNTVSFDEIYESMENFSKIIPQGSPLFGIGNNEQVVSVGNCFVVGQPVDSYGGILEKDQQLAQIMKRRGGVGIDISTIRPSGSLVKNSARTSDGITCFMERYSNTTKEVAQNGRRGALMISLDSRHPDLEKFINIKRDKTKVTGANISVKWHDDTIRAIKNNEEYTLRYPVDSSVEDAQVTKVVNIKDIWDKFVESNWESAEPGCLFWDTIIDQSISDCYADEGFNTVSTNPCIVGDTLIAVADGRNAVSIRQLMEEGKDVPVYSTDITTGQRQIKMGRNPRLTKKNAEVWKLTLDDGSELVATPDHKILTKNMEYVELKDLKKGDSLNPFNSFESNNYRQVTSVAENIQEGIHTVESVEFIGYEDVYNITVDDNHNYDVITSFEDDNYVVSSGITVKNCGEITLSEYGACILMLVNLKSFVDNPFAENASFNVKKFEKYMRLATRLVDDMIDLELEKVDTIISKIKNDPESDTIKFAELELWNNIKTTYEKGRRTGLGVTALGDMLARLNIKYSSEEALSKIDEVFKLFHQYTYDENANLAKERGAFPIWDWEKEKDSHYIKILPKETQAKIKKYGRRNIASNTCAPAGSVSILSQTSSGIEPIFMRSYERNRKMTQEEIDSGMKEAYTDSDGIKWTSYDVYHHGLEEWKKQFPDRDHNESPYMDSEAGELDWRFRVKLQGIVQKYIDHSISSTVNLAHDVTKEEVSELYMMGHEYKCKGVTIYRDGSRLGVLTSKKEDEKVIVGIQDNHAPRREKELSCEIHYSNIKNVETKETDKWMFLVGMFEGRPYEIFGGKRKNIEIPKKYKTGWLVKNGKNKDGIRTYDLYLGTLEDSDDRMIIKDVANEFSSDASSYTRIISTMLRHGVPLNIICEQLHKDSGSDMFSFEKGIARILKKNIKDGEKASGDCSDCGGELQYRDGCVLCPSCGASKCS